MRPGIEQSNSHLAEISKNSKQKPVVNVMIDDQLRAKILGDGPRGYEPHPSPT
jgi:hypothetical protein